MAGLSCLNRFLCNFLVLMCDFITIQSHGTDVLIFSSILDPVSNTCSMVILELGLSHVSPQYGPQNCFPVAAFVS